MKQLRKSMTLLFLLISTNLIFGNEIKVKPGIEVLRDENFQSISGKRVGLVTNASGVDSKLKSTIDILFSADNVNLVALFGPEHGVRGNIEGGDMVEFYTDEETGLPVYSIYGQTRKPSKEMLQNLDAIIYDIQDIGCRSYTFISTMGVVMEAAAENNIEVFVLDRPNPLGGNRIEGCYVEEGFYSFISQFKIPYVYGLNCGELAKLLNKEKMLTNGVQCKLTVIPMKGWKRDMTFAETGLPWVPTSPHIPHDFSSYFYVCSGIVGEFRDAFSMGVGYTIPFETFAAEWIDGRKLEKKMNNLNLEGLLFREIYYRPYYFYGEGEDLHGVQVHITDYKKVKLMEIQFRILEALHEIHPDKDLFDMTGEGQVRAFDKAVGTDKVRKLFVKNYKFSDIEDYLNKDVEGFRKVSEKYYLYK